MDLARLRRADWMVLGGGVVLIIGLFAFAWYSDDGSRRRRHRLRTLSGGFWALIVAIVIVIDYALALFSPQTQIPTTKYGRDPHAPRGLRAAAPAAVHQVPRANRKLSAGDSSST